MPMTMAKKPMFSSRLSRVPGFGGAGMAALAAGALVALM
jgi:hypothetical protein